MSYTFDIYNLDSSAYVAILTNIRQLSLLAYANDNFQFDKPFFLNYFKKENLVTIEISSHKNELSTFSVEFTAGSVEDIFFGTTLYNHIEYLKKI